MELSEILFIIFLGAGIAYATYFYWAVIITRKSKFPFENVTLKEVLRKALGRQ